MAKFNLVPRTWKPSANQDAVKIYREVVAEFQKRYPNEIAGLDKTLYEQSKSSTHGTCRSSKVCGEFVSAIAINKHMYTCKDKDIYKVLVHEVAHAIVPANRHDDKWRNIGNKVGRKWGITVECTNNYENTTAEKEAPYVIECPDCKHTWERYRFCTLVQYPGRFKCPRCNSYLRLIKYRGKELPVIIESANK